MGAVSIHAPARGATRARLPRRPVRTVSIHAPARGATAVRARVEPVERVSIHAPARGATAICTGTVSSRARFNSRARKGRDIITKNPCFCL